MGAMKPGRGNAQKSIKIADFQPMDSMETLHFQVRTLELIRKLPVAI